MSWLSPGQLKFLRICPGSTYQWKEWPQGGGGVGEWQGAKELLAPSTDTLNMPLPKHSHRNSRGPPFYWNIYTHTCVLMPTHMHMWAHRNKHTHWHVHLFSYTLTHAPKVTAQREDDTLSICREETERNFSSMHLKMPASLFFSHGQRKRGLPLALPASAVSVPSYHLRIIPAIKLRIRLPGTCKLFK